jgi:hypothetical protein
MPAGIGDWLTKFLQQYQQQQGGGDTLQATGQPVRGVATQDDLEPTGRPAYGSPTPGENAPQPTGPAGAGGNPLVAAFQRNYAKFQKGGGVDPLGGAVGSRRIRRGMNPADGPVEQTQGDLAGGLLHSVTHGAHAGEAAQEYNLGNGQFAHVYFDRNGKRQVNVFRR